MSTRTSAPRLPIVIIPGIQGRSEWLAPTLKALAQRRVTKTMTLAGDGSVSGSGQTIFDDWHREIDRLVDACGSGQVILVGVSFGGVVSSLYAARHPDRVAALVLASSPSPRWRPPGRTAWEVEHPLLALPRFVVRGVSRLVPEVIAAFPTWASRLGFGVTYGWRALRYPLSPTSMASWVKAWMKVDVESACRTIRAPTLVITGEPALDRVVPVASTLDYVEIIPGARHVTLPQTGHLGFASKPDAFAQLIEDFVIKLGGL